MLKIHSFLRKIKDTLNNFSKKMLRKYSKHMAVTAYAISAAILVFYFGDFAQFITTSVEYNASAATYGENVEEPEETKPSEDLVHDNIEYTLNSPHTNIIKQTITFLSHPEFLEAMLETLKAQSYSSNEAMDDYIELFSVEQMGVIQNWNVNTKEEALETVNSDIKGLQSNPNTQEEIKEITTDEVESNEIKANESEPDVEPVVSTLSNLDLPTDLSLSYNNAMKITLNEDEMEVLYRIVEAEATGEDIYGKILVANVVLNRVLASEFPDTVSDVVFQKIGKAVQFSPTKDGRYWSVKITDSTKEAVRRALTGEDYSQGALYFFARKLTTKAKANWFDTTLTKVVQYGCHEFYANKN